MMMNGLDEAKFMLMINRSRVRKSLIAEEGGWYNGRRNDPGGGETIGIGHHMDTKVTPEAFRLAVDPNYNGPPRLLPSDLKSISNPAAVSQILNDDIFLGVKEAREFLISPSLWEGLGDVRREVIVQMAFQMGLKRLSGFTKFRQALADRDYDKAAFEMLHSASGKRPSKWAGEDSPARARRMANAMRHNDPSYFQQGYDPYDAS